MIVRNEVDFGLSTQPGDDLGLDATLLFHERHYVLCREDHPFASMKSISMRDLRGQPYIHTVRLGVWQQLLPLLEKAKVKDAGFEVNQLGTLAGLVAANFGVALVPVYALDLCRRDGVVGIPFSAPNSSRPIYIVRRKGQSLSSAAATLFETLTKTTKS